MMFTSINDANNWIMNKRNTNYSFEHFKYVCSLLNNLQDDLKIVHVAGTDGKGSTVSYLCDLLMSQGYKVGTFTSPHYVVHQDRIRVNKNNIPDDKFIDILNKYYDFFIQHNLSMFEMDFIIMCEYFKLEKIDIAIIEVGLGGRLDSTNVINNPLLSIITTIGYDHMERLGNTLPLICREKCGIIKDNSKVLIGHLDDECNMVVEEECKKHNSELFVLGKLNDLGDRKFEYENETYELSSYAKYQIHNASLALYAFNIISNILSFDINIDLAKKALQLSNWNCRFEIVKNKPLVILDGAHNIHGIEALCESFDKFDGSKCIIFSALKRKEYLKMVETLKSHCDKLVITTFDNNEVIDLSEFKDYETNNNYIDAIDKAIKEYDDILICGSLYFMSEVVLNYKFDKI